VVSILDIYFAVYEIAEINKKLYTVALIAG